MSAVSNQPIAIFADQIRQGMRIEHPHDLYSDEDKARWGGVFTVTQVRAYESQSFFSSVGTLTTVAILGVRDDGSPYHYTAGPQMVWLCHDAGPVKAQ